MPWGRKDDPKLTLLHTHGLDVTDPMTIEALLALGRFTHKIDDERCPGGTCPFHARQWRKRARRASRGRGL